MAENKVSKQVNADRNNSRRTGKICEYLTYSGKEAFKRLRTNVLISLGDNAGKKCRVIGHIGMLHTCVDVTNIPCAVGDLAIFDLKPLLLKGIARSADTAAASISDGAQTHLLFVGDTVGGYTVSAIGERSVTLTGTSATLTLRLPDD